MENIEEVRRHGAEGSFPIQSELYMLIYSLN